MLIPVFYMKVNKAIMAVLMISISHRCNSPGVLLWDSFPSVKSLSAMPTKMGDGLIYPQICTVYKKSCKWTWFSIGRHSIWVTLIKENMQTKVTVIPILCINGTAVIFAHYIVLQYTHRLQRKKKEILYIIKQPSSLMTLTHCDLARTLIRKMYSHLF